MLPRDEDYFLSSQKNSEVLNFLEDGRKFQRAFTIILVIFEYSFIRTYFCLLSEIIWILRKFWQIFCSSELVLSIPWRNREAHCVITDNSNGVACFVLCFFYDKKMLHTKALDCMKDKIVNFHYFLRNNFRNSNCTLKTFSLKPGENVKTKQCECTSWIRVWQDWFETVPCPTRFSP